MKSKASINGHPIHPILVSFPVAFYTGTLLFDIAAYVYTRASFSQTAYYLEIAGVVSTLIAAIPGLVDYFLVVPPNSSAKKRATEHALINLVTLVLFSSIWLMRDNLGTITLIIAETVGVILLGIAGWMGGKLVFNNQIGVENRYADKGRWKEQYIKSGTGKIEVATEDELKTDQMKLLHIGDKRIVLGRTEKGYVAFDDRCTHRGASLAGGTMMCSIVQCPWHGSQFDVNTGFVKTGPALTRIETYEIVMEMGKVFIVMKDE